MPMAVLRSSITTRAAPVHPPARRRRHCRRRRCRLDQAKEISQLKGKQKKHPMRMNPPVRLDTRHFITSPLKGLNSKSDDILR